MVEECPHTCLAKTAASKIGSSISFAETEISILAAEPSHAARITDAVFREHHIFLVTLVKLADTALVGMCTDRIIGNAYSHPNHTFASRAFAHHLHDPSLVGVANGERFAP